MTTDWHKHSAPSIAEFEAIAATAFKKLPAAFRDMTKDVLIRVEDFPTDEVLNSLGIDSPFGLLGLYQGVDLTRQSVLDPSPLPEMIFLYRRPILDYWAEHDDSARRHRHPCAGARDRPSFRPVRRRHGAHRIRHRGLSAIRLGIAG